MDPTQLLLAQALSLSGLVGGTGAYAGIVRHRHERQIESAAADRSNQAVERVEQQLTLTRLEHRLAKRGRGDRDAAA